MSERPEQRFFRPDVQRDVDDELLFHLEMRQRELLDRGVLPGDARDAVTKRFGDVAAIARECRAIDEAAYREQRRASMWSELRQDFAYAVRMLSKAPGFTAVAFGTLALGIGGSTAIFSVVDAALLRALPYPEPDRLVEVVVAETQRDGRVAHLGPSVEDVNVWRADGRAFSHLASYRGTPRLEVLDGPTPERVGITEVSEDYFGMFGATPIIGRDFTSQDAQPGAAPVVVLGYGLWQRRFGGAPAVVGQSVRVGDVSATVIGVLPPTFYRTSHIWRPMKFEPAFAALRGSGATVYGRLRSGVTFDAAQQRLATLRPPRAHDRIEIASMYDDTTAGYRETTDVLAAAVGSILLIACLNVAGLLLARGATRRSELGIRASLGAGRPRLIRQMLVESAVLSLLGGAAGVLLAWAFLDVLVANLPLALPANSPPAINVRVVGFAAGLSLLTGLLFGLAPAVTLSRVHLSSVLSRATHRHGSGLSRRGGQFLIAAEVGLAIVLLAAAGLMIRSFARMTAVDLGFDPATVITMEVEPLTGDRTAMLQYYRGLVDAVATVPGIEAAGAVDQLPLGGVASKGVVTIDAARFPSDVRQFVSGYFEALGVSLREGRFPVAADATTTPARAVINETAARQLFPVGSAVGRSIIVTKNTYEVVGVISDLRHSGPLRPAAPEVYIPNAGGRPLIVVARSRHASAISSAHLREIAEGLGSRVVIGRIRRGSDWLGDRVLAPRQRTVLLVLLGGLGLILALVGVFGMTAYAVGRRAQEVGIRMALGARPAQVVRAIVRDSMWPVAVGLVVGLATASVATRVIASFLFDTLPTDPATFAFVAAATTACAWLAAWLPARKAARVDPVSALRTT